LRDNYSDNRLILFKEMGLNEDGFYIMSIFIKKSLLSSNFLKNTSNVYSTSDEILNSITESYKNLNIFYCRKEISGARLSEIRGEIFKIISILGLNGIIRTKRTFHGGKTIDFIYSNCTEPYLTEIDNFKISPTPLKLSLINDNYYLIGDFFTLVKKVFVENNLSNYYFKLNNIDYLEKLLKTKTYINIPDFRDALDEIELNEFKFKDTTCIVGEKKKKIEENNQKIREKSLNFKSRLISITDFENLSFLEIKKKIISIFKEYI